jgi:hypothetical protein
VRLTPLTCQQLVVIKHCSSLVLSRLLHMQDDVEVKLLLGDELRLKHKAAGAKGPWEGTGQVVSGGGATEEVGSHFKAPLCSSSTSLISCIHGPLRCSTLHTPLWTEPARLTHCAGSCAYLQVSVRASPAPGPPS